MYGVTYEERAQVAETRLQVLETKLNIAIKVLRQMHDAFYGTSESPGQDEANNAAKDFLETCERE